MDNIIRSENDWVAVRDRMADGYTYVIPASRLRMHHVLVAASDNRRDAFAAAMACNRILRRLMSGEAEICRVAALWDRDRHIRELEEARERCDRAMYVGPTPPSFFDISTVFRPYIPSL